MGKPIKRVPKGYDGLKPTGRQIKDLLPQVLSQVTENYNMGTDQILDAWPEFVNPQTASMTRAVSFRNGVLTVNVDNSSLLGILNQHEKLRLLSELQKRFSGIPIKNIIFRLGIEQVK